MKLLFAMLFLALLFPACKNKKKQAEKIEHQLIIPKDEVEFQKNISTVLDQYISTLPYIKMDSVKYISWQVPVREAYKSDDYKTFWVSKDVLTPKGKEMLHFVGSAEFLGLNKDLYDYDNLQKIVDSLTKIQPEVDFSLSRQLEIGLTRSFFQIALHVDHGMFGDTSAGINSNFWNGKKKYTELLNKAATDSISKLIASLEPTNPMYKRYMAAMKEFVSKNNISSTPIHIRDPKADSLGAVSDARTALVYHHYLIDSLKNSDTAYRKAMKRFQLDNNLNGDGNIGSNTIKALERDNSKKFQLLAINADRWRKEHIIDLPGRYVWVNLPSYRLKIIEQDTLRLEKNVVIGKVNNKNETPTLESAINQIVLWPAWSVPQDIIKHEMKSFKGFQVVQNGGWTSVVQPPGNSNALGAVKILFPNKYSVYIHDTPKKGLFGADFRAASHGCVRCQDPLEVAANLMMMDTFKITYDSLKALKEERVATRIFKLKKPVPVYFKYFTAEADFDGAVKFYSDVYGRDKDMINFIFKGKLPHVLTKEEKRERAVADSITAVKKKKADSLLVETKKKPEEEKLTMPDANAPVKTDSLKN